MSARALVCELVGSGRGVSARPAFEAGRAVTVLRRSLDGASIGDLVAADVSGRAARVVRRFGRADDIDAVMAALLTDGGRGRPFPAAVDAEVAALGEELGAADPGRQDHRDQTVVTVDPEGAKDHDDALAAADAEGGTVLSVHIADVSRMVPAGGPTDLEAARRGTSAYVPGHVDPMLPQRLSSGLCSLVPGRERNVVTAELLFDEEGEVRRERFYRSRVSSSGRLTYPEVDARLQGGHADRDLARLAALAGRLRSRRMARGALAVQSAEAEFTLADGRVAGVSVGAETPAHELVEECMIAANEAVARHLLERGSPAVFRHHEDPAESATRRLYEQLEDLELPTPPLPDAPMGPSECREAVRRAALTVSEHTRAGAGRDPRWALVLRSLRRAHYATDGPYHSGLASPAYLHFTSPIRRYPDLLVHRALLASLGGEEPGPGPAETAEAAWHSTEREREAEALERRADDVCAAFLLEDRLAAEGAGTVFEGRVNGAIDAGLFVSFGEAFEGFLPSRRLPDDHYGRHQLETGLVGSRTGRRIRLGDEVEVRVVRIEPLRGRVELEPADAPRRPGRRGGGRHQRR